MEVFWLIVIIVVIIGWQVAKASARKQNAGKGCPKCYSHNLSVITKQSNHKGSTIANQVRRVCLNCGYTFV